MAHTQSYPGTMPSSHEQTYIRRQTHPTYESYHLEHMAPPAPPAHPTLHYTGASDSSHLYPYANQSFTRDIRSLSEYAPLPSRALSPELPAVSVRASSPEFAPMPVRARSPDVHGPQPRSHSSLPSSSGAPLPRREQSSDAKFAPTLVGAIQTTHDGLLVIEGCLQGVLMHVPRRPHDKERADQIKSGSIFVYEENASGIKRWTDGLTWSPSRIMGNFLIYRELEKPFPPGEKKRAVKRKRSTDDGSDSDAKAKLKVEVKPSPPVDPAKKSKTQTYVDSLTADEQRRILGSLVDSYGFKDGGLVKKTMSIKYKGTTHHIISYYSVEDWIEGKLQRPVDMPSLSSQPIRQELIEEQNFRAGLLDEEPKMLVGYQGVIGQPAYAQTIVYPPPPMYQFGNPSGPRDNVVTGYTYQQPSHFDQVQPHYEQAHPHYDRTQSCYDQQQSHFVHNPTRAHSIAVPSSGPQQEHLQHGLPTQALFNHVNPFHSDLSVLEIRHHDIQQPDHFQADPSTTHEYGPRDMNLDVEYRQSC